MDRSRFLRFLALVVALLHLVVPPLATIADARVEREVLATGQFTVHVEDHGSPTCPKVHPTDCGLCQVVATLATPARAAHDVPVVARALPAPVDAALGAAEVGRTPLALPRAPPLA